MEQDLRRALKGDGLELHYQPLFSIDGQLHSLEALIRFRHSRKGLILPASFVSIAEESGLIIPLGSWVLNEVCRQSAAWQAQGLPPRSHRHEYLSAPGSPALTLPRRSSNCSKATTSILPVWAWRSRKPP